MAIFVTRTLDNQFAKCLYRRCTYFIFNGTNLPTTYIKTIDQIQNLVLNLHQENGFLFKGLDVGRYRTLSVLVREMDEQLIKQSSLYKGRPILCDDAQGQVLHSLFVYDRKLLTRTMPLLRI